MQQVTKVLEKETRAVSEKKTYYRWFVVTLIFLAFFIANADRANIGIVLPFLKKEYGFSNTEAGGIISIFFVGYAIRKFP
jgi:sugar phosphate permease